MWYKISICLARNTDCLQTESLHASERDSLPPFDQEATTSIRSCPCRPRYRARRLRSKGAILVIIWYLLASVCVTSVGFSVQINTTFIDGYNFETVNGVVSALLMVFAGWLADVYFGRYKVMKVSIWVMWLGSVGGTLLLVIYSLSSVDALKYVSIVVAYACVTIGGRGFMVNAVPFGTDQMLGASSEEISAFIHWFAWTFYTGNVSGYIVNLLPCTSMENDQTCLASMLFAAAISSVALCFDFLCQNWLVIEPVSQNPLKSIYSVLKYAATHKHPARRSALTYWEEDIPSVLT